MLLRCIYVEYLVLWKLNLHHDDLNTLRNKSYMFTET
jgi:hypothetical protein